MNKAMLTFLGAAVVAGVQYGCATADVVGAQVLKQVFKPDPTVVEASVRVASDANPDTRDRPSPIKVRFYLLKSANVLRNAGFFELKEQDRELLGDDVRLREEMVFKPGAETQLELKIPAEETSEDERLFLAVIAGYWDLDNATWRAVQEIEVNETTKAVIEVKRSAVSISAPQD